MPLTNSSGSPIYKRIAHRLRQKIIRGTYLVGHNLPTENELAEEYKASRHTIREALRELRQDGVIASRRGSGSVVCAPQNCQSFVHETSTINEIEQYAKSPMKVVSTSFVNLASELPGAVQADTVADWLLIEGYRYAEGDPHAISATLAYLHPDYVSVARLFGKRTTPLFELIEDNFGVVIHEVEQTVLAREVPEHIADAIGLAPFSMAIEVLRLYRLKDGKVVEISRNFYPPQKFNFTLKLRRSAS
ncbi:MAG: GntR family transcriptional regulator [Ottowia sp.]|uniref:GntR family transcriptional regulator n=1 Tax=Ottowia sp. TaxID=1898956 RepID=UPI003C796B1D